MAAFFANNGSIALKTKRNGEFTGSLRLAGAILPLKGKFNGTGEATVTVHRTGKGESDASEKERRSEGAAAAKPPVSRNVVVALKFEAAPSVRITGTVVAGGAPLAFTALPAAYAGVKPGNHDRDGRRYTVILSSLDPALGHGYATLVIAADGAATLAGKLVDRTSFTAVSRTVDDGNGNWLVSVHVPLYAGGGGMLIGEVLVHGTAPTDSANVVGALEWLRPASSRENKAKTFSGGFLKSLEPTGNSYQFKEGISLISGTAATGSFTLSADPQAAVLAAAKNFPGLWPKNNNPSFTASPAKLAFARKTGVFQGSFARVVNGKSVSTPYEGVILANPLILPGATNPVRGGGFFSTGTASGPVEVTAP